MKRRSVCVCTCSESDPLWPGSAGLCSAALPKTPGCRSPPPWRAGRPGTPPPAAPASSWRHTSVPCTRCPPLPGSWDTGKKKSHTHVLSCGWMQSVFLWRRTGKGGVGPGGACRCRGGGSSRSGSGKNSCSLKSRAAPCTWNPLGTQAASRTRRLARLEKMFSAGVWSLGQWTTPRNRAASLCFCLWSVGLTSKNILWWCRHKSLKMGHKYFVGLFFLFKWKKCGTTAQRLKVTREKLFAGRTWTTLLIKYKQ